MTNKRRIVDGEDRLSELPDDVVCHILSFLPTEEAIATCLLSTRWRFLWRMVPALDFECTKPTSHERLNKFLSLRTTQRITRFRLNCESETQQNCWLPYINEWFSAAISDGVVEHLNFSLRGCAFSLSMPISMSNVFTCTTIVTLKLKVSFVRLCVPSSAHLPSLKTLHLDVDPQPPVFKNFLYGSPALELFHLRHTTWNRHLNELKIVRSARHTRLFERKRTYDGGKFHLVIQTDRDYDFIPDYLEDHLENVVKAKVYITCGTDFVCHRVHSYVFRALKQLRNVEFLSLADFRIMDWPFTLDLPRFQNLVQLQLYLKDAHSLFMKLPTDQCPKLRVFKSVIMDDSYDINKRCPYHDLSIVPV